MDYFIDFENVGIAGLLGAEKLTGKDRITLFISEHTTEKGVLKALASTKAQIRIEYVSTTAKNAMDFCLISSVGAEAAKGKEKLCIVSCDRGYDAARAFWKEHGVTIQAVGDLSGAPREKQAVTETLPSSEAATLIAQSAPAKKMPKNAVSQFGNFLRENFKEELSKSERKKLNKTLSEEGGEVCQKMICDLKISKKKAEKIESYLLQSGIREIKKS